MKNLKKRGRGEEERYIRSGKTKGEGLDVFYCIRSYANQDQ